MVNLERVKLEFPHFVTKITAYELLSSKTRLSITLVSEFGGKVRRSLSGIRVQNSPQVAELV